MRLNASFVDKLELVLGMLLFMKISLNEIWFHLRSRAVSSFLLFIAAVFHFEEGLDHLDVKTNTIITYTRGPNGHPRAHAYRAKHIVGADGAGSRTRQALKLHLGSAMSDEGTPLGAGYKELLMPLGANGKPSMDVRSLHIWPRGSHFLMALPNKDGSFTMTLYLPVKGDISFESIKTTEQVIEYFKRFYPDALPLMPALAKDWRSHPQGFLGTVRAHPWHVDDKVVLLGDAAHAITPFFGQGCNAAFEGVRVLDAALTRHKDVADAYSEFDALHKPNADAIAQMAVENYVEMMQKTGDQHFLLQKALEVELAHRFPSYLSRYAMVTHTLVPYAACIAVGDAQQRILDTLCPQGTQTLEGVDYKKAAAMVEKDLAAALKANKVVQGDLRDVSRELVLGATKTAKL